MPPYPRVGMPQLVPAGSLGSGPRVLRITGCISKSYLYAVKPTQPASIMKMIKSKKSDIIKQLFRPNGDGESEWVTVPKIKAAGLKWSSNGNVRRGVAFGFSEVLWEFFRAGGPRSKILKVRMRGLNKEDSNHLKIHPSIRENFKEDRLCNLSRIPIPNAADREIDHRYGDKDHPDYVRTYSYESQRPEDFQLIHRVLNQIKRQVCLQCVATGSRPPHPELGYAEGDKAPALAFPCRGCYLAEPEKYRKIVP